MNAYGVNIFDEADGDHVVVFVTDNLKLQLFPSEDRLLYQNLVDETGLKTSCANCLKLIPVVNETAACATHGIGRTENHRIAELISYLKSFFNAVGNLTSGHLYTELVHGFLKLDTVFATLNGIHLYSDYLNTILVKDTFLIKFGAEVET